MPYRTTRWTQDKSPRIGFFKRLWYRYVGKLVYGGEPTCGHCKYWKNPNGSSHWYNMNNKGDCRLMFGEQDKFHNETCERFQAKRRFKHREKS